MVRYVRSRDLILLWTRAAGMCAHPDCKKKLVVRATENDEAASIGEAAHIVARQEGGPRGEIEMTPQELDRYGNLILLCANHHSMVDAQEKTYTVEVLRTWKAEHEAWVEAVTTPERRADVPWTVILQEEGRAIDGAMVDEALGPGNQMASLIELRSDPVADGWEESARRERRTVALAVSSTLPERRRFAVFSLGRIPLAVQMGYVLGDRARVSLFQYDRDRGSWRWGEEGSGAARWTLRDCEQGPAAEAAIRVSLSARVKPEAGLRFGMEVDICVPEPSVRWLRTQAQLVELARVYGEVLSAVRERGCRRVHLFYAGPAPGAVAFGRAYNPRMNPELVVYEHRHGQSPSYERALVLNP